MNSVKFLSKNTSFHRTPLVAASVFVMYESSLHFYRKRDHEKLSYVQ